MFYVIIWLYIELLLLLWDVCCLILELEMIDDVWFLCFFFFECLDVMKYLCVFLIFVMVV